MSFIWGLVAGIGVAAVVCLLWPKKKTGDMPANEDEAKKRENIAKIESYIGDKDKFTNDELQMMLGVSDTTIGRYLEDLEKEGKIEQVGNGPDTYYAKK